MEVPKVSESWKFVSIKTKVSRRDTRLESGFLKRGTWFFQYSVVDGLQYSIVEEKFSKHRFFQKSAYIYKVVARIFYGRAKFSKNKN